jgi:hypothetical protein
MPILRLEHAISDFEVWKAAFDRDPVHREQSGVRRYQVFRPVDDPNYIAVDLEFDTAGEAETFRDALRDLWASGRAAPALRSTPNVRIVDAVETREY